MSIIVRASRSRSLALAAGLVIVAGLGLLDVAWGRNHVVIATVMLGAFVTALFGGPRATALVGVSAFGVAALSATWDRNFGQRDYLVRLAVVTIAAGFAVASARQRDRVSIDQHRMRLLDAAVEAGGASSAAEIARGFGTLLVPSVADVCAIDYRLDGSLERVTVGASELDGGAIELPPRGSLLGGDPRLLTSVSGAPRAGRFAATRGHLMLVVPLQMLGPGGIGSLVLALAPRGGRRFADADLRFARVYADQLIRAFEKAGFESEIERLQAQRTAALENLAEAVVIHDTSGRWVYANTAAAQLFGYPSPDAMLADPTPKILDRFEAFHEDGRPLADDERPGRAVLDGRPAEPILVRVVDRETGAERWRVTKATAVTDASGRPQFAINIVEDVTDVKRAELDQAFLARASELLAASLDIERTLTQVAELAVPQLCDWCSVAIPQAGGKLRRVALAHRDPDRLELVRAYEDRYPIDLGDALGPARVIRSGLAEVVEEVTDDLLDAAFGDVEQRRALRAVGIHAAMLVPMLAGGRVSGAMTFVIDDPRRTFSESDRRLAEELARRAGSALANAQLYTDNAEIAQTLQASLLPRRLPEVPGFQLCSVYSPAGQINIVGGDFYDAIRTPRGAMVLIGDVTGRGAQAAALTAEARHSLRVAAELLGEPVVAVEHLNRSLANGERDALCTVAAVDLSVAADQATATIVCAGHPLPVLIRAGQAREVGVPGPLVGAWADSEWTSDIVVLEPGDVLVLYTDGVTDTKGTDERFGTARLLAALSPAADASDAITLLTEALERFRAGGEADDVAAVAIGMSTRVALRDPAESAAGERQVV